MRRALALACLLPLVAGCSLLRQEPPEVPAAVAAAVSGVSDDLLIDPVGGEEVSVAGRAVAAASAPLVAPYDPFASLGSPESCYVISSDQLAEAVARGARHLNTVGSNATVCWRMVDVPLDGGLGTLESRYGPLARGFRPACRHAPPHGQPWSAEVLRWAVEAGIIVDPSGTWQPAADQQAQADLEQTCDAAIYGPFCAADPDNCPSGGGGDPGCGDWRPGPIPPETLAQAMLGGPPRGCPGRGSGECWWTPGPPIVANRECRTAPPPPPPPVCGDNTCNGAETCASCPADCGPCEPESECGDGSRDPGEDCTTCPEDMPEGECEEEDDTCALMTSIEEAMARVRKAVCER